MNIDNNIKTCYFCGSNLFISTDFYQYCKNCWDDEGCARFFIYGDELNIGNSKGNLLISITNGYWYLEYDYSEVLSGRESISIEEGINIMNRYEKIKAFD